MPTPRTEDLAQILYQPFGWTTRREQIMARFLAANLLAALFVLGLVYVPLALYAGYVAPVGVL